MRRHGRRVAFMVALLSIALVASGCFLLDANRRNNFKGPSWDVDVFIPLVSDTFSLVGEFDDELEDSQEHLIELGKLKFDLPEGWPGNPIDLDQLGDDKLDVELDLQEVWDLLADVEEEFEGVKLTIEGALRWTVVAPEGLKGEITLELTGETGEGEVSVDDEIKLGGGADLSDEMDITLFLQARPDTWMVKVGGELEGEEGFEVVGSLQLYFDLLLTLKMEFDQETEISLAERTAINIDSDMRERLRDIPLTDVELVLNVEPVPFGFTVALRFTDGDDDDDDDPAYLAVSVGVDDDDAVVHDWRGVLDKLAGRAPHVEPILIFADSDDPISLPPSVTVTAHVFVKADVNKQ